MAGTSAALRSGSGTCASLSLISFNPHGLSCGLIAGRYVAPDKLADLRFDRRALQHDTAVRPLDLAVAALDLRLCQDHKAALESALLRQPLDPLAGNVVERIVNANDQMRR